MNPWDRIKEKLAARVGSEAYESWISKTSFIRADRGSLWISVLDEITRQFMQQEYAGEVWLAMRELELLYRQVVYEIHADEEPPKSAEAVPSVGPVFSVPINLNPKFTFKTFVVGSCNQFAHAAAQAVATVPSKTYNPLLIYGGVGMGKTHLMHAVGRSLLDNYPGMRILYVSAERFTNDMINSFGHNRIEQFRQHYRQADALLIDDIQFIGGKERTQEEFFYTFNELYEHDKQIVMSSDSPPRNTAGLVERLRSRFEWGLMVDVQPPDLETKMAILDRKAEIEGIHLPEEVRVFIATKTKSNMRELEGALVKLMAYSSVTGMPITQQMAQQVLKHLTHGDGARKLGIEAITKKVAEWFSLTPAQVKQKSNSREIAYPRQLAMYLVKELTPASLPEIGRAFGGKHHTTVLHSIQKIEKLRQADPDLNSLINKLIDSLQ